MSLLNSESNLSKEQVEKAFSKIFGEPVTRRVKLDETVVKVLKDRQLWSAPERMDESVAVVDAEDRVLATTSRGQLINGLLSLSL